MTANYLANVAISIDTKGMIEYWDYQTFQTPSQEFVTFKYKTETDLYDLVKAKTTPFQITMSPNGQMFATISSDRQIRVFDFINGKILRKYDESYAIYSKTEDMEIKKKLIIERELDHNLPSLAQNNLIFDESSHFLLFSTIKGIKIISIASNKVVRILGNKEKAERFLFIALYQGIPQVDQQ